MASSANETKAKSGASASSQGRSAPVGGSVLSFSSDNQKFKPVAGKPTLVRLVENNGQTTEVDFWNSIVTNDVKRIEVALSAAKADGNYSMDDFISKIEYQAFDRAFYIKHALSKMSLKQFCEFAIIGALRGSNFQKIIDTCDKMPDDLIASYGTCGFVKTPKKRTDLTILRGTASIPHWCAYWLRRVDTQKKIPSNDCPACIQFPGAASLPMSEDVRKKHFKFCYDFSMILPGGRFNVNIYMVASQNQIPLTDIPLEVLEILDVKSSSENYRLKDVDIEPYNESKSVVKRGI